jgi:hypothetical protein
LGSRAFGGKVYLAHSPCEAVIVIEPNRVDVRIDLRAAPGWVSARFTSLDDTLRIPSCGVACRIAALYARTPLGAPPSGFVRKPPPGDRLPQVENTTEWGHLCSPSLLIWRIAPLKGTMRHFGVHQVRKPAS